MKTKDKLKNVENAIKNLYMVIDLGIETKKKTKAQSPHQQEIEEKKFYQTIRTTQESIQTLLDHFHNFYKPYRSKEYHNKKFKHISSVVTIASQAIENLDKCTRLFKNVQNSTMQEMKEYKQLENFYFEKFLKPKLDTEHVTEEPENPQDDLESDVLGEVSEAKKDFTEQQKIKNLETVKEDLNYDLFLLHRPDGSRFFNKQIEKSIRLLCLFEEDINTHSGDDPFIHIQTWRDEYVHLYAKQLLTSTYEAASHFLSETKDFRKLELVAIANSALMALMLCANPLNLLRNSPAKSCWHYFKDFQIYLRKAFASSSYLQLEEESSNDTKKAMRVISRTLNILCSNLFSLPTVDKSFLLHLERLIEKGSKTLLHTSVIDLEEESTLDQILEYYYQAIGTILKHHPNGPLFKALDMLIEPPEEGFDPFLLSYLPGKLQEDYIGASVVKILRIPSPTRQTTINNVTITEEFKQFLRGYEESNNAKKHLMINLQNRTSWKEYTRCVTLEKLPLLAEHSQQVIVVTFAKDTDFYHQKGLYVKLHKAKDFMEQLYVHISSEETGFYFPSALKKELFPHFTSQVIKGVHELFFDSRKDLTVDERKNFIESVYLFIEYKIVNLTQPYSMSFTCKDGIDVGPFTTALFVYFFKAFSGSALNQEEQTKIYLMLFTPSLLYRERLIHPDYFHRLTGIIKLLHHRKTELSSIRFEQYFEQLFSALYTFNLFSNKKEPV